MPLTYIAPNILRYKSGVVYTKVSTKDVKTPNSKVITKANIAGNIALFLDIILLNKKAIIETKGQWMKYEITHEPIGKINISTTQKISVALRPILSQTHRWIIW